jgi:hypothetical protein
MHYFRLSPRRAHHRLAGAMMLGALAACADSSYPVRVTAPTSPTAIIIIGGKPGVLNAQLRAIGNPDEKPLSAVVGHFQLVINRTEDGGFVVDWRAHIANPECNSSTSFAGADVVIQDSEDFPSPEDVAVVPLLPSGDPLGCGDDVLQGSSPISPALAALLVEAPESFTAAFFLEGGGVIFGPLQLAAADPGGTR